MSLDARIELRLGDLPLSVALEARAGETVALLGPNGAGKTTLLRVLAGLVVPDRGRVTLDDVVLEDVSARVHVPTERRRIGLVFQDHALFPHLSVLDNVAFGPRSRGMSAAQAANLAREWLARYDLLALAAEFPSALSGGHAQRVALARALATEPRLLLLDEPLAALDASARARMRRALRGDLDGFGGVRLLVTHDPVDALTLADRVVILEHGTVAQSGTVADVARHPRSRFVADLLGLNFARGALHAGELRLPSGAVLYVSDEAEGHAFAAFRPSAVALHRSRPEGSPRNVFRGTIEHIEVRGDRCRVSVTGSLPLVAEVTPAAVAELRLAAGDEVWASVKALEIEVYPV